MTWMRIDRLVYMPISLCRVYRQCKISQLFIAVLGLSMICYIYWYYNTPNNVTIKRTDARSEENLQIPNPSNIGCKMPILDTFNPKIMKFYKDVYTYEKCDTVDWVACRFSKCHVTQSTLAQIRDVSCVYKDIIYVNDNHYYLGQGVRVVGDAVYTLNRSDQVTVSCSGYDKNGYGILQSTWSSHLAGFRPIKNEVTPKDDALNVLLLIFDSVSRLNFMRRLPKSYKYLTEELGAVVLKSYNIVGDGTPSAMIPILSGHFETELPDARQGTTRTAVNVSHYIFPHLKKRGYRTAYFEDLAWLGTFQYRFNGFSEQPSDHYLYPFFRDMTKLRFRDHANVYEPNTGFNKWVPKIGLAEPKCIGSKPVYEFMFNYTAQLFEMQGKKLCVTFNVALSHDELGLISVADEALQQLLTQLRDDGKLEDTAVVVMSDHGARFFAIRNTYQGKIEERLPFMSIILPERLKRRRPQALINLKSNIETLTTPFDIHSTILDILDMNELRNHYTVPGANVPRGMSLIDKIPISRSCADAAISPHWCACAAWRLLPSLHPTYSRAARALATYVHHNTALVRTLCAKRRLISIEAVYYLSQNPDFDNAFKKNIFNDTAPIYYQAKIIMSPNNAIFEGSMQYIANKNIFNISEENISRVNAYGDESQCIFNSHPHLRKYCYCKSNTLKN